ncbi:outer membrane lipoprotein carrier protein LolA [Acidobacteriota bacterium]
MRRLMSMSMAALLLVSLAAAPGFSQDVSDILEKMIEATGGRKVLEAIKDTTMVGEMDLSAAGMQAAVTIYHKEPNKFRQEMEVMGMLMINAFDGETGWFIDPQTQSVQDMTAAQLEESKKEAFEFGTAAILDPEKHGITFTFKGKETVEGKEYLVLVETFPNGEINTLYVEPATYLLRRMKQKGSDLMGSVVDQELIFEDYKKVDGVLFSYSMTILQAGAEFGVFTLTEVTFNSGLEDSLFAKEK